MDKIRENKMRNWKNVKIEPYHVTYNKYNQGQYSSCKFCGADAVVIVSRTSTLTDNTYNDYACQQCANKWNI